MAGTILKQTGTLFLIPSEISDASVSSTMPDDVTKLISTLEEFIVEDERTARRFLKKAGYAKSLDSLILHTLNKHTDTLDIPGFIDSLLKGKDVGLLSEAGCPCVADPGAMVVGLAHEHAITVKPLVGPSSILLALMASGFNGQHFIFHGYIPVEKSGRIKKIREMEAKAKQGQTQIFMETPYRNMALIQDILHHSQSGTMLCIASELSGKDEKIISASIEEWKKIKYDFNKKPAIFLLSR
jgi:16S rRNA (cytidine1402-2'-O)-methyltransferase